MARPRNNQPKPKIEKTSPRQERLDEVATRPNPKLWGYVLHFATSRQPVTRNLIASFASCTPEEAEEALQEAANKGWYRKVPLSATDASIYGYSGKLPK